MKTIQTNTITPSRINVQSITGAPVTPSNGVRGPGRPSGGKDWQAAALGNTLPDFQIENLTALIAALPLVGRIKKTLPVFLPVPDQMKILGEAIASGDPAKFQAAMFEASKPTGTAEIMLAEYAKTNNSAVLEKEEISDMLTNFCAAVRRTVGLADKRVIAYLAEKQVEADKNKEAEAALKNEAADNDDDDDGVNAESNPVDADDNDEADV